MDAANAVATYTDHVDLYAIVEVKMPDERILRAGEEYAFYQAQYPARFVWDGLEGAPCDGYEMHRLVFAPEAT